MTKIQLVRASGKVIYEHEEEHNSYVKTLRRAIVCGIPLNYLDVRDQNLDSLSTDHLCLTDCVFAGVNFARASITSTDFTGSIFKDCIFANTSLANSIIDGCRFNRCPMTRVNFKRARLTGTTISKSSFTGAVFESTVIDDCKFHWCEFKYTDWKDTSVDQKTLAVSDEEFRKFIKKITHDSTTTSSV